MPEARASVFNAGDFAGGHLLHSLQQSHCRGQLRVELCSVWTQHVALCLQNIRAGSRFLVLLDRVSHAEPVPSHAQSSAFCRSLLQDRCAPPAGTLAQRLPHSLITAHFFPPSTGETDDALLTVDGAGQCTLWLYDRAQPTAPTPLGAPNARCRWQCITCLCLCRPGTRLSSLLLQREGGGRLMWTETATDPRSRSQCSFVVASSIFCPGLFEDLGRVLPSSSSSSSSSGVVVLSDPVTLLEGRPGGGALLLRPSNQGAWIVEGGDGGRVWHYLWDGQMDGLSVDCRRGGMLGSGGSSGVKATLSGGAGSSDSEVDGLHLLVGGEGEGGGLAIVRVVRGGRGLRVSGETALQPGLHLADMQGHVDVAVVGGARAVLCDGQACWVVHLPSGHWNKVVVPGAVGNDEECLGLWSGAGIGLWTSQLLLVLNVGRDPVPTVGDTRALLGSAFTKSAAADYGDGSDGINTEQRMDPRLTRLVTSAVFLRGLLDPHADSLPMSLPTKAAKPVPEEAPEGQESLLEWSHRRSTRALHALSAPRPPEEEGQEEKREKDSAWPLSLDLVTLLPVRNPSFSLTQVLDPFDVVSIPPLDGPWSAISVDTLLRRALSCHPHLVFDAVACFAEAQAAASVPGGARGQPPLLLAAARRRVVLRALLTAHSLIAGDQHLAAIQGRCSLLSRPQQRALLQVLLLDGAAPGAALYAAHTMRRWGLTDSLGALRRKLHASATFLLSAEGRRDAPGGADNDDAAGGLADGHADKRNYRPPVPAAEEPPDWPLSAADKARAASTVREASLGERRSSEARFVETMCNL